MSMKIKKLTKITRTLMLVPFAMAATMTIGAIAGALVVLEQMITPLWEDEE